MILMVPNGDELEIEAHQVEEGHFLCMASTEFGMDYRIFMGDEFIATEIESKKYRFDKFVGDRTIAHYQFDLGLFAYSPDLQGNRDGIKEVAGQIGEFIEDGLLSPGLRSYLADNQGGFDIDEFIQCVWIILHIPRDRSDFLVKLPFLSNQLAKVGCKEVYSGDVDWGD